MKTNNNYNAGSIRLIGAILAVALGVVLSAPLATIEAKQKGAEAADGETVILLHGMWRNSRAMNRIENELQSRGYRTVNVSYPSTDYSIEELAVRYVHPAVQQATDDGATRIHFVTHSMGGILARYYLETHAVDGLGRVVMIAPPNQGVEVAEKYRNWAIMRWATGPAGRQLGTGDASLPRALGPVKFDLGVIAGAKGRNLLSCMIPGEDDGLVSVESTRVPGMRDHLVLDQTHYYIKRDERAIREVIRFLKVGRFNHESTVDREAVASAG